MLVFIDDSGDAGFKLEQGSSRYFVIALVIFDDDLEAEKTAVAIKEFRRACGFSDAIEFKFSKTRPLIRKQFLMAIRRFKFRIRSLVVDKTLIRSHELQTKTESFYSYIVKSVLKQSSATVNNARIKLDGSGNRLFRRKLLTYLRRELNQPEQKIMASFAFVDSKENVLIQLADMVAGSIRRSHETTNDAKEYKRLIQRRIEDEWRFR